MTPRVRVRAIIEYEGQLLLVRNRSSPDFWALPGGGVDNGEDIITALHRELVEETGIVPLIGKLLYVHQFGQPGSYQLPEFFFHVRNGNDYQNIDLSTTSHGSNELAEIDFKQLDAATMRPDFIVTELPTLLSEGFDGPTRFKLSI